MSYDKLKTEVLEKYKSLSFDEWNSRIISRGGSHKSDKQLKEIEAFLLRKTPIQEKRLFLQKATCPSQSQISGASIKVAVDQTLIVKEQEKLKAKRTETGIQWVGLLIQGIHDLEEVINAPMEMELLEAKIELMSENLALCIKDHEFREAKLVKRVIHGSIYYIDNVNGDDTHDGLKEGSYTADAGTNANQIVDAELTEALDDAYNGDYVWNETRSLGALVTDYDAGTKTLTVAIAGQAQGDSYYILKSFQTISQFTTLFLAAGEIGKVRANQTHVLAANITVSWDGDADNYIELRGCTVADDPWHDASNVRPILNFNAGARYLQFNGDDYWLAINLNFTNSTTQGIQVKSCRGVILENCDIYACLRAIDYDSALHSTLRSCNLYAHTGNNTIDPDRSHIRIENCIFNAGGSEVEAIRMNYSSVEIKDTTFGATNAFPNQDIWLCWSNEVLRMRNVLLTTGLTFCPTEDSFFSYAHCEDYQQVKGAHKSWYLQGTVTKDTGVTHPGGANSSAKMEPTTYVYPLYPLTLVEDWLQGAFKIWCPAAPTTVTVYIRSLGAWTAYPTNAQLYIMAEYWDDSAAKRVESPHSVQVLTDVATWVAFTTTFTPSVAGWAYVKVHLNKFEAAKGAYVDVKPVVA